MKKILVVMLVLLMSVSAASALEVGGKNLPDTLTAGKDKLILNGAGIRVKWFMDIYSCGLYLSSKNSDAQKVMDVDEPMAIKMIVISGLMTEAKMEAALRDGFEKATGGNLGPIQARIEKYIAGHKGEIKQDDVFDVVYVPGEGVNLFKNGRLRTTIKGLDFKKPLFGIWLGEEPADDDLKEAMLGK